MSGTRSDYARWLENEIAMVLTFGPPAVACADCGGTLTVADLDGKRYCRVDAGRRLAAGEDVTYDEDPADGQSPSVETDCRGSGIYDCPCEADGLGDGDEPDGLCACCRSGEANGSCAVRPLVTSASETTATEEGENR